ncbi:plasmid partitioning protein RepB [Roseibium sp. RKSG952]|uniref:plasmid partitioning protein RepB n=1 Tax=Roseibium sp. RKSG952 TaxID=2529384 RepID=UPI0012BC84E7|nr:plasmid partitioning protein RepB [Roseibium sp. RKSG952]MTH95001.1 plasmid partitioning protein RepB [Roseibium sp. RKSG952]
MTNASNHSKKMKALFGGVDPAKLAGKKPAVPGSSVEAGRVTSGTVKSMSSAFSTIEKENEELRQKLQATAFVERLSPNLIDPSPYRDRFEDDEGARHELDELKESIAVEGQKIAVLVRPHPSEAGRYQLAYGHRRVKVLRELYVAAENPEIFQVNAYVRALSDSELIKEQSLENAVRENLSWIELAMWARQLKSTRLTNRSMAPILGIPESGVSRLIKISEQIPDDVARAIGRAKESGRRRWAALAQELTDPASIQRVRALVSSDEFKKADGDKRISLSIDAAAGKSAVPAKIDQSKVFKAGLDGDVFAKVKETRNATTVTIPNKETDFAKWLTEKIPDLRSEYLAARDKES